MVNAWKLGSGLANDLCFDPSIGGVDRFVAALIADLSFVAFGWKRYGT
jgi:hypothetical protein